MGKTIDLEELGITQEKLVELVAGKIVNELLYEAAVDDEGVAHARQSQFERDVKKQIIVRIDEAVGKLVDDYVPPNLYEMLAEIDIPETNYYGERTSKPMPFKEYLVTRAQEYLKEDVDFDGRPFSNRHGGRKYGTRASYMVNEFFMSHVGDELKKVVNAGNELFADGLQKALRDWLKEMAGKLKVDVGVKR